MMYIKAFWYLRSKKTEIPLDEKITFYYDLLKQYNTLKETSPRICDVINKKYNLSDDLLVKYFPELIIQKPFFRKLGQLWWPIGDLKSREEAIKNAIRLLLKYKNYGKIKNLK